jgi:hypothetical protein
LGGGNQRSYENQEHTCFEHEASPLKALCSVE